MNPHYSGVAERAAHRCKYCQAPEAVFNFPFEVEHIIPPGRGGADEDANRALSCRSCNVFKSDHVEATDPLTGTRVPLFDPRRQRWQEHFRAEQGIGHLVGLTSVGRATINLLQMSG
ncbi:MAG: HNH endonuclease [Verrucomicrobia bacterium]|nr:MAG: HNH endonuclease [Verrucomicrobiota bacterium]